MCCEVVVILCILSLSGHLKPQKERYSQHTHTHTHTHRHANTHIKMGGVGEDGGGGKERRKKEREMLKLCFTSFSYPLIS